MQYTTNDPDLAALVVELTRQVFGSAVEPRINRERRWYEVYLAAAGHLTDGVRSPVAQRVDGLGVFGLRSHEKFVPPLVFQQPAQGVARFLRHLWSTDGCIHLSRGSGHYVGVYYASSSPRLAKDVQSLLLRLGINATLSRWSQGSKGRDQHHVVVSGRDDLERFLSLIGGLGIQKQAMQDTIADYLSPRPANTNRDVLPKELWQSLVVPAMRNASLTTRTMQASIGTAYCGTTLYKANLSRERAARVATAVKSKELAILAQSDVYWDRLLAIEADGEEDVYDLTVDDLHNFVADDVIVHNSIEQDSDVVLFIYRDRFYNDNLPEDRRNIAELIIAKHRNGPVGKVELLFIDEQTRFANLDRRRMGSASG